MMIKQTKIYTLTAFFATLILGSLFFLNSQASIPTYDSQGQKLPSLAPMLERITDSVVNISTLGVTEKQSNGLSDLFEQPIFKDPLFNRFLEQFGQLDQHSPQNPHNQSRKQTNLGSGVIVNAKKGYVLTNNHVIENADKILVTLKDGRKLSAELIGSDKKTDIALLKVPSKNLTAIPLSNSDQLRVGDFAVAIGNPFGLGQTVTSGIISALGRTNLGIEGYEDFIQTDASINPGNSGGALVNLNGKLIGINTAILSKAGGNVGIGFAIPINMVKSVMQQLINHGQVKRGILGVHIQDLTPDLAEALNIEQTTGAIIAKVIEHSSAQKAGLKNGDVIIQANKKSIKSAANLRNFIGLLRPGEKVAFKVIRQNKSLTLKATISGDQDLVLELSEEGFNAKQLHPSLEGAIFKENKKFSGLQITEIKKGSPAWHTGLKVGDRVISVNRYSINNIGDLQTLSKRNLHRMAINILRGNTGLYLVLE